MSDGRQFTDYNPRCQIQTNTIDGKVMNNYELRQYLIHNAVNIMSENRENVMYTASCPTPINTQGTMLPEQTIVKCDKNVCSVVTNDQNGIGQGRFYGTT
jgi:hypothetical protein